MLHRTKMLISAAILVSGTYAHGAKWQNIFGDEPVSYRSMFSYPIHLTAVSTTPINVGVVITDEDVKNLTFDGKVYDDISVKVKR